MNDNILFKLANDLSHLYATTQIKSIEDIFVKVAAGLNTEIQTWLSSLSKGGNKVLSSLNNPEIIDAFLLLEKIRQEHPAGFSPPEFVKIVAFDEKLKSFLPILMGMREFASTNSASILVPYIGILNSSRNFPASGVDVSSDLKTLERSYRDFEYNRLNSQFEENAPRSKPKSLSKNEKMRIQLGELTSRFAEEIVQSFSQSGQLDSAGIMENPNILRDPNKVCETMFPKDSKNACNKDDVLHLSRIAKNIVQEASKFRYSFNFIRTSVLVWSGVLPYSALQEYIYKAHVALSTGEEDLEEMKTIPVSQDVWNRKNTILLLSITLYLLGSKIK